MEGSPIIFTPTNFPVLPPPSCSAINEGGKLTNENLLKSIGFIPGPSPPPMEEPGVVSKDPLLSSTDKLLQTFEVISDPNCSTGDEPHLPSGGVVDDTDDDDDFVFVVPDCFDLDKPLADFSPPTSLSYIMDPSTTSCDSHVSIRMSSLAIQNSYVVTQMPMACDSHVTYSADRNTPSASFMPVPSNDQKEVMEDFETITFAGATSAEPLPHSPTPAPKSGADGTTTVKLVDPTSNDAPSPKPSPPTAHKSPSLAPSRLTLRTLKGGLYRRPLAVATGLVNAVSGFVDDKVHFVSSGGGGARGEEETERKPTIQFAEVSESESSDDEFEVSNLVLM